MLEQQLVATSIQVVLNTDEALSNEGLENKFSIVSTDGTNTGHVRVYELHVAACKF